MDDCADGLSDEQFPCCERMNGKHCMTMLYRRVINISNRKKYGMEDCDLITGKVGMRFLVSCHTASWVFYVQSVMRYVI